MFLCSYHKLTIYSSTSLLSIVWTNKGRLNIGDTLFDTSERHLHSYIGTIYILASTVSVPVWASCAGIFGRYWTIQSSLVIFIFGSALSTGAINMPMMLAGRGIAGVGAAGLLIVSHPTLNM